MTFSALCWAILPKQTWVCLQCENAGDFMKKYLRIECSNQAQAKSLSASEVLMFEASKQPLPNILQIERRGGGITKTVIDSFCMHYRKSGKEKENEHCGK